VYLAATGQNRGKTTFALGLLAALLDRGLATAFIKPVGQRYAMVGDVPADEDAILMHDVFALPDDLATMSPVHIPRGFTRRFIEGDITEDLGALIRAAHARIGVGREMVVVEGTGHAGVGSVIGLSNADVAAMLATPAIIVSEAGVGRPIDEIVLNHALFARRGVRVLGAVVNKVDAEAHPSLPDTLRTGLARHGIALLGTLPYRPILSNPTLSMLIEQMPGEVLHAGADLDRRIEHVGIGAMQPRHVIERIGPGSLLILPGDREDVIHATIAAARRQREMSRESRLIDRFRDRARFGRPGSTTGQTELAGILFTGGYRPRPRELEAIRSAGMFAYLVEADTYAAASTVHDLLVKTHPADRDKIAEIRALVAGSFDVDGLLERLDTMRFRTADPATGDGRRGPTLRSRLDRLRGRLGAIDRP
jgi:BioD-like phosphotransacetylase family protein